jgi:hypothetical protein
MPFSVATTPLVLSTSLPSSTRRLVKASCINECRHGTAFTISVAQETASFRLYTGRSRVACTERPARVVGLSRNLDRALPRTLMASPSTYRFILENPICACDGVRHVKPVRSPYSDGQRERVLGFRDKSRYVLGSSTLATASALGLLSDLVPSRRAQGGIVTTLPTGRPRHHIVGVQLLTSANAAAEGRPVRVAAVEQLKRRYLNNNFKCLVLFAQTNSLILKPRFRHCVGLLLEWR